MPDLDDELIARALRWCAESGHHATPAQVRAALAPLSWDELLTARALLADPPPRRALGPSALADMARGVLPDAAAEREHARRGETLGARDEPPAPQARERSARSAGARRPGRQATGPVIRRARDRVEAAAETPRQLPSIDELFASEGRARLERLVREHGARRGPIQAALAAGWRRRDGSAPGAEDLTRLLDAHGLARAFEVRERDELLHALRAAAGVVARAASAVALSPDAFRAALERLGASRAAESIRALHRDELWRRGTLSERVRLLLADPQALSDLEILAPWEAELRERLPEHVRAMRASGARPLYPALARSLAIAPHDLDKLGARLGLDLGEARHAPTEPPGARAGRRGTGRRGPTRR